VTTDIGPVDIEIPVVDELTEWQAGPLDAAWVCQSVLAPACLTMAQPFLSKSLNGVRRVSPGSLGNPRPRSPTMLRCT
jgi:hypothetical protein